MVLRRSEEKIATVQDVRLIKEIERKPRSRRQGAFAASRRSARITNYWLHSSRMMVFYQLVNRLPLLCVVALMRSVRTP